MGLFDKSSKSSTDNYNDQANKTKMSTGTGSQLDISNVELKKKATLNVADNRDQSTVLNVSDSSTKQQNSNNKFITNTKNSDNRQFSDSSIKQMNSNNVLKDSSTTTTNMSSSTTNTTTITNISDRIVSDAMAAVTTITKSNNQNVYDIAALSVGSSATTQKSVIDMAKTFKDGTASQMESMKWIIWPILAVFGLVSALAVWKD